MYLVLATPKFLAGTLTNFICGSASLGKSIFLFLCLLLASFLTLVLVIYLR